MADGAARVDLATDGIEATAGGPHRAPCFLHDIDPVSSHAEMAPERLPNDGPGLFIGARVDYLLKTIQEVTLYLTDMLVVGVNEVRYAAE